MTPLFDQFGNTIAYLHKQMLIDTTCEIVLGLIIGNCVFGNKDEPVGKFFNNTIRDVNGRIAAKTEPDRFFTTKVNEPDLLKSTWRILMHIKSHVLGWIPEINIWSEKSLREVLSVQEPPLTIKIA